MGHFDSIFEYLPGLLSLETFLETLLASLWTIFTILWSAHGSVKARMHDLISFSVSQITFLDTCNELRYVFLIELK